jgi:hypothetical protein
MKTFKDTEYERVIASIEKSAGNDRIGDMWIKTKSFDKTVPICEILNWAHNEKASGKLILTIDESTVSKKV